MNPLRSVDLSSLEEAPAIDESDAITKVHAFRFPARSSELTQAYLRGEYSFWEPIDGAATRDQLPEPARRYLEFVERELRVPVELVGVGAGREHVLA